MINLSTLPVVYAGLSNDEYHSGPGLSSTQLKTIADKSLAHLITQKHKDSAAKDFGSLVHTAVLEPHLIDKEYVYTDEAAPARNTKEGKLTFQAWQESNPTVQIKTSDDWKREWFIWQYGGRKPISCEDKDAIDSINQLISRHPFSDLLKLGQKELSIFWEEEIDGMKVLMKARPDLLLNNNMLIDLKTTDDASEKGINKAIAKYNYHWSLAYHMRGIEAVTGVKVPASGWVFVEKNPPYAINMKQMPDEMKYVANDCIDAVLKKYVHQKRLLDNNELDFPYGKDWTYAKEQLWMQTQVERL
jgi:exodeoxyribonuclease VIII